MKISKEQAWDYFILVARVLLALVFLDYGFSKLFEEQFGISQEELATPVTDLSLFELSWYLFNHEPFNSFVGVSQIIAGLLLLYHRTAIIGCLMALPIHANILIVDITFIKITGFYWRIPAYILLDLLILWHYKDHIATALNAITHGLGPKFKYPLWAYLILPIMAVGLEIMIFIPKMLAGFVMHPKEQIEALSKIPILLADVLKKIFS